MAPAPAQGGLSGPDPPEEALIALVLRSSCSFLSSILHLSRVLPPRQKLFGHTKDRTDTELRQKKSSGFAFDPDCQRYVHETMSGCRGFRVEDGHCSLYKLTIEMSGHARSCAISFS